MIHYDLGIPTVQDVIHDRSNKHRVSSKPTPTNNIKGQYPTETEMKMANWPVIRSKRPPRWRGSHRVRKSTGWTLASTLAYGMQCIPIADQIIIIKKTLVHTLFIDLVSLGRELASLTVPVAPLLTPMLKIEAEIPSETSAKHTFTTRCKTLRGIKIIVSS